MLRRGVLVGPYPLRRRGGPPPGRRIRPRSRSLSRSPLPGGDHGDRRHVLRPRHHQQERRPRSSRATISASRSDPAGKASPPDARAQEGHVQLRRDFNQSTAKGRIIAEYAHGGHIVVTLREAFEASLILGIVYAYLDRMGGRRYYGYVTLEPPWGSREPRLGSP